MVVSDVVVPVYLATGVPEHSISDKLIQKLVVSDIVVHRG